MKLSVVIVNYNTRDDLRACLASLRECSPLPEIIVVDNASTDGSAEMVAADFPEVVLVAPGRNLWFTGGNNLGLAVAHSEYVILLNPDTVVPPDALTTMLAWLDLHTEYDGVTAQLRYPDGNIQRTCSRIPTFTYLAANHTPLGALLPRWRARLNAHHWYAGWDRQSDRDIDVPPGSCLMARRDRLRLDEDLLLYFPEDDLACNLGTNRFRYLAGVQIIHREKAATRTWRATDIYFRDLLVYTYKHHGALRGWLLWLFSRPLFWGMWLRHRLRDGDAG